MSRGRRHGNLNSRLKLFVADCSGWSERLDHRRGVLFPAARFLPELPSSLGRQAVELGAPVVLRDTPLGRHRTLLLQPVERLIQRRVLESEAAIGALAEEERDAVAVVGPQREGLEDQQIDGAGQERQ